MRWLKGVVKETRRTTVRIELETGRKIWATPHFKLDVSEQVLIAWDYTNDCIGIITTKERWNSIETERDKVEGSSMIDVFLSPLDDEFEGDLNGSEVPSNRNLHNRTEESEPTSIVDVFPVPLDEDVDRDDMVELRDDITH